MGANSAIGWTTHSFNPWWGCIRVSAECEHCYAETFAKRLGQHVWGPAQTTPRRFFGEGTWRQPLAWNADAEEAGERARVFCASMADVFEDRPDLVAPRLELFKLIALTPWLDWLLLTKRPENMVSMAPRDWSKSWPLNVWAGTSAGDQAMADLRYRHITKVPALVRFWSLEPLLGPIPFLPLGGMDWVIVGGESAGPPERRLVERKAGVWVPRSERLDWVRVIRDQCAVAGTPLYFKQWGGRYPTSGGRLLDGQVYDGFPRGGLR
jgi:protein gp37